MPTQNQQDTRRSGNEKPDRQNPRRDADVPGQQPQRDRRQAGNTDRPEVGNPVPAEKRKPRDPQPIDDPNDIDDSRRADDDDVERDRPNPRLQ
jgi:hypothetical protein